MNLIRKIDVKQKITGRNTFTYKYFLKIYGVCRTVYLNAFGMGAKKLRIIQAKKKEDEGGTGITSARLHLMRSNNANKKEAKELILKLLNELPKPPSLYCRRDTRNEYIQHQNKFKSLRDLYDEYYVPSCTGHSSCPPCRRKFELEFTGRREHCVNLKRTCLIHVTVRNKQQKSI